MVSHTRVSEDEQTENRLVETQTKAFEQKGDSETTSSPIIEKTTFGDIEELVALKEKLENQKAAIKKEQRKSKSKRGKAEETIAVEDEKRKRKFRG